MSSTLHSTHFLDLPNEVLERVFIYAQSSSLAHVNTLLYCLTKSNRVKGYWLAHTYRDQVLFMCWKIRFMSRPCGCATNGSLLNTCRVQDFQMDILYYILQVGIGNIEHGLVGAAALGHLKIVELLIQDGADCNVRVEQKRGSFRSLFSYRNYSRRSIRKWSVIPTEAIDRQHAIEMQSRHDHSVSLLQMAVDWNYLELASIILSLPPDSPNGQSVTYASLQSALQKAIQHRQVEMAQILISKGNAVTTIPMLKRLLGQASYHRILFGNGNRYADIIVVAIQGLSDTDLDARAGGILKNLAEIGCVRGIKACINRGVDINLNNGLALCSCIYNGNMELFTYLIDETATNVHLFAKPQFLFCISLMSIEILAMSMFGLLLVAWLITIVESVQTMVRGESPDTWMSSEFISVWDLTGVAIPSILAIALMYHLVPIHRMIKALTLLKREQRRRRLDAA